MQICQRLLIDVRGWITFLLKQEVSRILQSQSVAQFEQLRQVRGVSRVVGSRRTGDDQTAILLAQPTKFSQGLASVFDVLPARDPRREQEQHVGRDQVERLDDAEGPGGPAPEGSGIHSGRYDRNRLSVYVIDAGESRLLIVGDNDVNHTRPGAVEEIPRG